MQGKYLFNNEFLKELNSQNPNLNKIKKIIIDAYNKENEDNIDLETNISKDKEELIIKW